MDLKPFMSAAAFAKLLGRDPRTIQKWCTLGYLPHIKEGEEFKVSTFSALNTLDELAQRGADIKEAATARKIRILPGSKKASELVSRRVAQ